MKLICSDEICNVRPSLNSSIPLYAIIFLHLFNTTLLSIKYIVGGGNSISIGRLITITSWLANSKDLYSVGEGGWCVRESVHEGDKVRTHSIGFSTMKGPKIWKGYVFTSSWSISHYHCCCGSLGLARGSALYFNFLNFFSWKILIFCLMYLCKKQKLYTDDYKLSVIKIKNYILFSFLKMLWFF